MNEAELFDAYSGVEGEPEPHDAVRPAPQRGTPVPQSVWRQVRRDLDGHWIWTGRRTSNGYPLTTTGRNVRRLVYSMTYEVDLIEGEDFVMTVSTCAKRLCVRPDHLALVDRPTVTRAARLERGHGPSYHVTTEARHRRVLAIASAIPYDPLVADRVFHDFSTICARTATHVVHRHAEPSDDDVLLGTDG